MEEGHVFLDRLLRSPHLTFDSELRRSLPEDGGVYRIYDSEADPRETLRAGRTKTAAGGLRQRVYGNHFMGNQPGNLRAQLVRYGRCGTVEAAKEFIRNQCRVQVLVIKDEEARKWTEHFILSVLRPAYSD